jgi:branched-chain amino acid aminotransferase
VAAEIKRRSAWEALLTDPNGFMPEASRSNLFAVKNGEVITSPDEYILTGITRKYVLEACRNLGMPVNLRLINLDEIEEMDSLFLTSTSLQLAPVCQVNNLILPLHDQNTRDIMKEFDAIKKNHLRLTNNFS